MSTRNGSKWPRIREATHKNGKKAWMVDARIAGRGERFFFPTKTEAQTKADQLRVARKNEGDSALTMPAALRADAEAAMKILAPHKRTLREAAEFFVKHLQIVTREMTIETLIAELLTAKAKDGASKRYLKDMRRLNIFAAAFPQQKLTDFSTARIDDWLRALPHSAVTRNGYKRLLGVLFSYAVQRGYMLTNPAKGTTRAKQVPLPPGVLTVEQSARLLECAEPEILPAVALGLFGGLRPESEVWRLDWSSIDFESRLIDVAADKTKTAQKRFVSMGDNLIEWLLPQRKSSGPVSPAGDKYHTLMQRARKTAKITKWPSDCLRHTFGSMHYAAFQNIGMTMEQMGHSNPKTFLHHYRERVKKNDAARYWQITPQMAAEKVVQFAAAV